jgi:hypothetical protein
MKIEFYPIYESCAWLKAPFGGIIKILECILVFLVLFTTRLGDWSDYDAWGGINCAFLSVGTCVGYAIIDPLIMVAYLVGSKPTMLELITNLIGGVLFITMGATLVTYTDHYRLLGGLQITTGIIHSVDFCYIFCTTSTTENSFNEYEL